MAPQAKYHIRCEPDCPYHECVIVTTIPPIPVQQPRLPDMESQEGENRDSNNSGSNNSVRDGGGDGADGNPNNQNQQGESGSQEGSSGQADGRDQGNAGGGQDQRGDNPGDRSKSPGQRDKKEQSSPGRQESPDKDKSGGKGDGKDDKSQEPKRSPKKEQSEEEKRKSDEARQEQIRRRLQSPGEETWEIPEQKLRQVEEYKPIFREDLPWGHGASHETDEEPPNPGKSRPTKIRQSLTDAVFRARLKNIMIDNAYDRRVRGRKRGKLDMRSLHKVPAKSENVFTLKEARKNKHYNVLLLVDESGSMAGMGKATKAAQCAVFLAKSFEGINVNVAIVGFNHFITTRKTFTSPANYDLIYKQIASMNNRKGSGDNNDWDALNKAYDMFRTAPDGQNILIMLSDGYPASGYEPRFVDINGNLEKPPKGTDHLQYHEKDGKHHLHALVRSNHHKVKSIGIGIMQGGWQIPNHEVIESVAELKPVIIDKLRQEIKRG